MGLTSGSDARFDELYAQHGPELLRYLRRLTGSVNDGRDLLQETFLRLWAQPDAGAIANVRAWLFRVATNVAQNHQRGERRARRREEVAGHPPTGETSPEQLELQWQVQEALAAIDARSRRVLLLFAEGFSYREIASITGVEPGYVGVLMHRARIAFRKHFEQPHVTAVPFRRRLS